MSRVVPNARELDDSVPAFNPAESRTDRFRVLLVATHPTQYGSPIFRRMQQHPRLEILVAYCSLQGAERGLDPEFEKEVAWDIPLLDGYPWVHVPSRSSAPALDKFWGLTNPGLWKLIREGRFDAVVTYTGYVYASFWIALVASKRSCVPLLFGTDSHELGSRDRQDWKLRVKRVVWPWLFRLADVVIVPSSGSVKLIHSLGIPPERVVLTPYAVDNTWWVEQAARVDRPAVRARWGISPQARVVLFCAKLQPWKRPGDLLRAMARAGVAETYLVYAGDGPLWGDLEAEARGLGWAHRVRFLGFANQSELPAIYRASDLLVLPSDYEPFGVVVNEAMLCDCAVIVSDRVGARFDLVRPAETGFVFPCGDVDALAGILRELLSQPERLERLRRNARAQMDTWSPRENIAALLTAMEKAVRGKRPRAGGGGH